MDKKNDDRDLDVVEVIIHDAAVRYAMEGISTRDERRRDEEVAAAMRDRVAELRRRLLRPAEPAGKAKPIRASLVPLGRDALVARLDALTRTLGATVQYAHRDIEDLDDDDLRSLIDAIESLADVA